MAKRRGKGWKKIKNKEKEAEDWCFECKEGGELIICDHRDCPKVYHPDCVKKDGSFSKIGKHLTCGWHYCFSCHKTPIFFCLCCPRAVCGHCISPSDFAIIRGSKGLCSDCSELVLFIEKRLEYDSSGEKIDMNDIETYECLFKEYWEIIKEKEGITTDDVCGDEAKLRKAFDGEHRESGESEGQDEMMSSDSDINCIGENKPMIKRKRFSAQEFVGWGSKPLLSFLTSIGKDISKPMSQLDVHFIIKGYIAERNLIDEKKKKMFIPDGRLLPIFGKKAVSKNRVYDLLEDHIQNSEQTIRDRERSENEISSADGLDTNQPVCKKRRPLSLSSKSRQKKVEFEYRRTGFANINVDNMKLIYLRKRLVEELSQQPESFEDKVVGSFVKVKRDPYNYLQRRYHQLVLVTGVKRNPTVGEVNCEILLEVSFMSTPIPVSKLFDSDITEEDCEDLRHNMENGLLQKLTVDEFQQKADSLQEDITKHWIKRELDLLQQQVDRANVQGLRRLVTELLDKRELLKKPCEQQRLLKKLPLVDEELIKEKCGYGDSLEINDEGKDLGSLQCTKSKNSWRR
ncbi:Zinc finger CCCH domain protein [Quillaja saponaria]|uniref:Zinc finger CCCH domain protein n=1 Tax=Quillaja saponaria TaxID=32244 RepID=A0AAD7VJG6_QUISA|nr:Zinc finger CCCH domain protein [Quillaja saponaria]